MYELMHVWKIRFITRIILINELLLLFILYMQRTLVQ